MIDTVKEDTQETCYGFEEGRWVFDNKVVSNWNNEMEGHIPGYWDTIDVSYNLVSRIHDRSARILVFWVGTGNQLIPYLDNGWDPTNFMGFNYSAPLHAEFRQRFPGCASRQLDVSERPYNPMIDAPFDVVQMHWSLHFEPMNKREQTLRRIFNALNPGGTLLLTDKTLQPRVVEVLYHGFKRDQGVSDEEIAAKKKAIVGVLQPLPSHWYENTLEDLGFVDVCVVNAKLGFVTWLARKP